ncbi:MAG: hypothetical protein ACTSV2_12530 [Candidatus Thorarchaeota archaeon]
MELDVQRCDWCGTTDRSVSRNIYGGHYCSRGCMMADRAERGVLMTLVILAMTIFVFSGSFQAGLLMTILLLMTVAYTYIAFSKRSSIIRTWHD